MKVTRLNLDKNKKNYNTKIFKYKNSFSCGSHKNKIVKKFSAKNLSQSDKLFISVLLSQKINLSKFVYLDLREICRLTKMTYNQVRNRFTLFLKVGLLTRIFQNKKGRNTTSRYKLNAFVTDLGCGPPTPNKDIKNIYKKEVIYSDKRQQVSASSDNCQKSLTDRIKEELLKQFGKIRDNLAPNRTADFQKSITPTKPLGQFIRDLTRAERAFRERAIRYCRRVWKQDGREVGNVATLRKQLTYLILKHDFNLEKLKELLNFVLASKFWDKAFTILHFVCEKFWSKFKSGKYQINFKELKKRGKVMVKGGKLKEIMDQLTPLMANIRGNYKEIREILEQNQLIELIESEVKSIEYFRFINKYETRNVIARAYAQKHGENAEDLIELSAYESMKKKTKDLIEDLVFLLKDFRSNHEMIQKLIVRNGIYTGMIEEIKNIGNLKNMPTEKIKSLVTSLMMPSYKD